MRRQSIDGKCGGNKDARFPAVVRLRIMRAIVAVLLLWAPLGLALAPAPTWSKGVVVYVDGFAADRARADMAIAIPKQIPVIPAAIMRTGKPEPLGPILAKAARRKNWLRALDQAVASAGAEGAVVVYIGAPRGDRREELLLLVRGAEVLIEQRTITGDETSEQRVSRWRALLESSLGAAEVAKRAAPPESEIPVESKASRASEKNPYKEPAAAPKPANSLPPAREYGADQRADQKLEKKLVVATLGPEWAARYFRHSEPTTGSDRRYTARKIGGLVFGLELYPGFASNKGFWRRLALTGEYATSIRLESRTSGGEAIATHWYRYGGGLHVRFPLVRSGETPAIGLGAGYGKWLFTFDAPAGRPQPTADYQILRGQVDGQLEHGPVLVFCALSYLHLLSVGDLGEREATGIRAGAEARIGTFFRLSSWFRLGTTGAYTHFFYSLKPLEQRNDDPGDVTDGYLSVNLLAQFRF